MHTRIQLLCDSDGSASHAVPVQTPYADYVSAITLLVGVSVITVISPEQILLASLGYELATFRSKAHFSLTSTATLLNPCQLANVPV